jgi:uncharacterized membrane protein
VVLHQFAGFPPSKSNILRPEPVRIALVRILQRREVGKNVEDERDTAIRQRAANVGYHTLAVLLVIFAVTVGFSLAPWYPLSPLAISYTVIGILMLSDAARTTAEAGFYRRDRT